MWNVNDFKVAAVCHLGFSKFTVYVTWLFSACYRASYCKKLLKSDDRLLSYVKNDFDDGNRPPSWILKVLICGHVTVIRFNICCSTPNFIKFGKICSFGHVAFVGTPFCFLVKNFAEIGQWSMSYGQKNRFSRWRPSVILNFKNFNIWSHECHRVQYHTQLYSPLEKAAQLYTKKMKVNT